MKEQLRQARHLHYDNVFVFRAFSTVLMKGQLRHNADCIRTLNFKRVVFQTDRDEHYSINQIVHSQPFPVLKALSQKDALGRHSPLSLVLTRAMPVCK